MLVAAARLPAQEAAPICPFGHVTRAVAGPTPKPVVSRKKQEWEAARGGSEAAKAHIVARLTARPTRFLVDRSELPQGDSVFAWRVARDTWRGLQAFVDRDNGLPVDHVRVRPAPPSSEDASAASGAPPALPPHLVVGDYTNVTNIGLLLVAVAAAHDIGLVASTEAQAMASKVLATLEKLETHRGSFFNYYDTTSIERTSNFLSFVDSSWLTAGLIMTRVAFPALRGQATKLIERTDYGSFYDRKTRQIAHGTFVDPPGRSPYDYGILFTEARLGALLAIGKGDVPREQWFAMARILPAGCEWQSMSPVTTDVREVAGARVPYGQYEWKGARYVPSWGGSMFEALMPTLVLNEVVHAGASLGLNGYQHAVVQQRFAREELGYPVWGLSPSVRPPVDDYSEFGVPVLGVRGYGAGVVSPHASALALAVTHVDALANLRELAARYDIYGDFGFYDAVDPRTGQVAYTYLTLDQSMLFIALANHLGGHSLQERFATDPIVRAALPLLASEDALWLGNANATAQSDVRR